MGRLTKQEIQQLRKSLEQRGLTYKQLQDELLDHLICDIESYMEKGLSFQQAWQKVDATIPKNQFTNIQTETMEIINKKPGMISTMTIVSLAVLIVATIFKMIHWPGADILLIVGLALISLTTVLGVFKGFYISPYRKGGFLVLVMGLLFVSFIISILFQTLHWNGATSLRIFSVIGLVLLFPALSIYFYQSRQKANDHIVIKMLEQNRNKINRVLLSLVILAITFKLPAFFQGSSGEFVPVLFPVLSIFVVGLYIFTLTWKPFVTNLQDGKEKGLGILLISSLVAFVLFILPGMDWLFTGKARMIMSLSFYVLAAAMVMVYYKLYSFDRKRNSLAIFSLLILLISLFRLFITIGFFPVPSAELGIIYHLGVLIGLILLLIIYYKKPVFRAFMLLMLAHYTLTYPVV